MNLEPGKPGIPKDSALPVPNPPDLWRTRISYWRLLRSTGPGQSALWEREVLVNAIQARVESGYAEALLARERLAFQREWLELEREYLEVVEQMVARARVSTAELARDTILIVERELLDRFPEIEQVLRQIQGATDVQKDQTSGTPQLLITIDRGAIARYGINVSDVQEILSTAVGGQEAGQISEGVRRFNINLRFKPGARDDAEAIGAILVESPSGAKVPLSELATMKEIEGARQITREYNQRFITVQCNVRGRDIGSFVAEAEQRIREQVDLPPGYRVRWGGQFELQQAANRRLAVVIPITLALVFIMLYSSFQSVRNAVLIILNIPLALVGGVVALYLSGENLSVPASVGFIALFGIALENGLVLITFTNCLVREGHSVDEASVLAACQRLRPVVMTAATTALGLLPY